MLSAEIIGLWFFGFFGLNRWAELVNCNWAKDMNCRLVSDCRYSCQFNGEMSVMMRTGGNPATSLNRFLFWKRFQNDWISSISLNLLQNWFDFIWIVGNSWENGGNSWENGGRKWLKMIGLVKFNSICWEIDSIQFELLEIREKMAEIDWKMRRERVENDWIS